MKFENPEPSLLNHKLKNGIYKDLNSRKNTSTGMEQKLFPAGYESSEHRPYTTQGVTAQKTRLNISYISYNRQKSAVIRAWRCQKGFNLYFRFLKWPLIAASCGFCAGFTSWQEPGGIRSSTVNNQPIFMIVLDFYQRNLR